MLNDVRVTGTKGEPNSALQSSPTNDDAANAAVNEVQAHHPLHVEARGILFVISSPSGGGKGTLIRRILPQVPRLGYSVSWTTRAARPGEMHGVHYLFVTPAEFAAARAHGDFLESATVHGHLQQRILLMLERIAATINSDPAQLIGRFILLS